MNHKKKILPTSIYTSSSFIQFSNLQKDESNPEPIDKT